MNKIKTNQTMHEAYSEHPDSHTTLSPKSFEAGWQAALASVVPGGRFEVGDTAEAFHHGKKEWVLVLIGGGTPDSNEEGPMWTNPADVRPLPQTVDLTVEEKAEALVKLWCQGNDEHDDLDLRDGWKILAFRIANGKTIDELCQEYGVATSREA